MSRYLLCYDVHNSEENRAAYEQIKGVMENCKDFTNVEKRTESVYLFDARLMDLEDLRGKLKILLNFIPDFEFYVFRLAEEPSPAECLAHIREEFNRHLGKK